MVNHAQKKCAITDCNAYVYKKFKNGKVPPVYCRKHKLLSEKFTDLNEKFMKREKKNIIKLIEIDILKLSDLKK